MIIFKDVFKKYNENTESETVVLSNINLQVPSSLTIIGPSGSGKTTLLRCINGLEEVSSGEIFLGDLKVEKDNIEKIRKRVGMVFQSFHLFSNMSVMENLIFAPMKNYRASKNELVSKAQKLLKHFNIDIDYNRSCNQLSGGQKQRVAICRSLMMSPEVMLLDEPTSALDVESIHGVIEAIRRLKDDGVKVIIVTHDVNFARAVSDRIVFMDKGEILDDLSCEDFFKDIEEASKIHKSLFNHSNSSKFDNLKSDNLKSETFKTDLSNLNLNQINQEDKSKNDTSFGSEEVMLDNSLKNHLDAASKSNLSQRAREFLANISYK